MTIYIINSFSNCVSPFLTSLSRSESFTLSLSFAFSLFSASLLSPKIHIFFFCVCVYVNTLPFSLTVCLTSFVLFHSSIFHSYCMSISLSFPLSLSLSPSLFFYFCSLFYASSYTFDTFILNSCIYLYQLITKYFSLCANIYLQSHRSRVYPNLSTHKQIYDVPSQGDRALVE